MSIHAVMAEIQTAKKVRMDGWTDGFSALYSRLANVRYSPIVQAYMQERILAIHFKILHICFV